MRRKSGRGKAFGLEAQPRSFCLCDTPLDPELFEGKAVVLVSQSQCQYRAWHRAYISVSMSHERMWVPVVLNVESERGKIWRPGHRRLRILRAPTLDGVGEREERRTLTPQGS